MTHILHFLIYNVLLPSQHQELHLQLYSIGESRINEKSIKGRVKKIWNFRDLVGGWVRKSPFSRFKKNNKYALKMHKNA